MSVNSISSELFMLDPSIKDTNKDFVTKGNEEHVINTTDDVFTISGDKGSFQLHRDALKETLAELRPLADTPIRKLTSDQAESFKNVVEALKLLYESQALYDIILKEVREVFDDVKQVKPGTVAAFFVGCFNDDKFTGPVGCSPKCASSLPPAEGTPGYSSCSDLVLIYADGAFSSLNEKKSLHAYIYIDDTNFKTFKRDNIQQLKDSGIENVTLVFGNDDGTYKEITDPIKIDKLPMNKDTSSNSTSTSSTIGIVVIVIVILLIIALLALLYLKS